MLDVGRLDGRTPHHGESTRIHFFRTCLLSNSMTYETRSIIISCMNVCSSVASACAGLDFLRGAAGGPHHYSCAFAFCFLV